LAELDPAATGHADLLRRPDKKPPFFVTTKARF
jgi:hypothetical protein